jgi:glycosyltransferase involved in cell wall biosynthesis
MNSASEPSVLIVSIVIPVYNNSESLVPLASQILEVFGDLPSRFRPDVVFIEDGSRDDSWEVITKICSMYPESFRALKLSRNFGQLAAIIAGWDHVQGDAIVNMSADLQDPPALIMRFVDEWQKGSDVVIGIRESRGDDFFERVTSKFAHKLLSRGIADFPDTYFDYTLISNRVLKVVRSFGGRHRFPQGEILFAGFNRSVVPYERAKRQFGKSGYNFWKRLSNFTDAILDSSYILIQSFTRMGVVIAICSFIYAAWIIGARLTGLIASTGWAPIMVCILFFSGLQMVTMGIIAEYIWRIYDSSRVKPSYVINEVIESTATT